jgi:hypothetical protein
MGADTPIDPRLLAEVESVFAKYRPFPLPLTRLPEWALVKQTADRAYVAGQARADLIGYLIQRDGYLCFYCRRPFNKSKKKARRRRITLDHLIPHQLLPHGSSANYVLACEPCNTAKDNQIPTVLMPLLMTLVVQQIAQYRIAEKRQAATATTTQV